MKPFRACSASKSARMIALTVAVVGSAGAAVTPEQVHTAPAGASRPAAPPARSASHSSSDGGLKRCLGSDGVVIFTDRRCEDLRAQDLGQRPAATRRLVRNRTCAKNQDDLLFGVRSAIESRDPNRLANFYHWAGLGNAEGYRVMDRLGIFLERPLLDVQLVSSRRQPSEDSFGTSPFDPPAMDARDLGQPMLDETFEKSMRDALFADPAMQSAVAARPRPASDLLRVEQMRNDQDLATQVTFFRLRSNAGCWWLQF